MSASPHIAALNGATVLVTGCHGFVGRATARALSAAGARVVAFDRVAAHHVAHEAFIGDICDATAVAACMEAVRPHHVVHLAAFKERVADPASLRTALEANLFGTLSVLEAVRAVDGVRSVIALGTAEEYGDASAAHRESDPAHPVSPYSLSKLAATELCLLEHRLYATPVAVLRPTVAYGPGQPPEMFIPALLGSLVRGERFPMSPGEQTRDFVFVDDLADAVCRALVTPGVSGKVINVGSGEAVPLRAVAEKIAGMTGGADLLGVGELPYRDGEIMRYAVDVSLARELLGWHASVTLDEGLSRTVSAALGESGS